MISTYLNYQKKDVYKEPYAQNRFKYQYTIGDSITLRLIGPELKSGYASCMIELKGEGCREFENNNPEKTWIDFLVFFVIRLNASPTRIDLAIDDYEGSIINFKWLKENLDRGQFLTTFKNKRYTIHGNQVDGFSLQLGSRTSVQELVIYEKNKEQRKKGIECNQEYWLRFEMRFRQIKAYDIAMNIINLSSINGFKTFAYERLFEMLDFKVKNNYNEHNQRKAQTDPNWLKFLGEVNKAKLVRYKISKSTYETYLNHMNPRIASYVINLILHYESNIYLSLTRILEVALYDFEKMDDKKLKRYNDYLSEANLKEITEEDLEELKTKIEEEIERRSDLPF